jgi:hypothetical protein
MDGRWIFDSDHICRYTVRMQSCNALALRSASKMYCCPLIYSLTFIGVLARRSA